MAFPGSTRTPRLRRFFQRLALGMAVTAVLGVGMYGYCRMDPSALGLVGRLFSQAPEPQEPRERQADLLETSQRSSPIPAPELDGGVGWLNTAAPIHMKDLRGKIVLLDFWTFCCINCIHTLPDLAKLEKKYANELVVIGVHSAKFDNEKNSESIRKAISRYEIAHPVVNDADMEIWKAYGVRSWPSLYLIDPEGNFVGRGSGEGLYNALDEAIGKLVRLHREKKTLDEHPLRFQPPQSRERADSPLFFPGKVLADANSNRLFIADSTHHRIVITDLDGKKIAIAGTGRTGRTDGSFATATFNDPQGMALRGDTLFVADRKNHLIRSLDLKIQSVTTLAGNGEKGLSRRQGGVALQVGLNSPWDLCLVGDNLYVAMAGHHQIWVLDLAKNQIAPFAGTGKENIDDGPLDQASFAQPSGLATDGTTLFVADSEVSAIRAVPLGGQGDVRTIVGLGLFDFGDANGKGNQVRLQHPLGVAHHHGKLLVADTYNSKVKLLDPSTRASSPLAGEPGGWLGYPLFNEPGGLSVAGQRLYVADTNGHRIQVVDLRTKAVATLALHGVDAPKLP
jgi:thiol-disulfide isomerase/thioredoxin